MLAFLFLLPVFLQFPIIKKDHYETNEYNQNDKLQYFENKIDHFNESDTRTYQ